eukprot:TRINITY_DN2848_c0_g1_i2.p1 TRINITY_DN2848_c0_g1~~TRINITY_DN2848_c0_g1_i2.p1  ORF type:complete len:322 (-),score=51.17 TRINITY_DN2848_c0_g1_i2:199-1164(-)
MNLDDDAAPVDVIAEKPHRGGYPSAIHELNDKLRCSLARKSSNAFSEISGAGSARTRLSTAIPGTDDSSCRSSICSFLMGDDHRRQRFRTQVCSYSRTLDTGKKGDKALTRFSIASASTAGSTRLSAVSSLDAKSESSESRIDKRKSLKQRRTHLYTNALTPKAAGQRVNAPSQVDDVTPNKGNAATPSTDDAGTSGNADDAEKSEESFFDSAGNAFKARFGAFLPAFPSPAPAISETSSWFPGFAIAATADTEEVDANSDEEGEYTMWGDEIYNVWGRDDNEVNLRSRIQAFKDAQSRQMMKQRRLRVGTKTTKQLEVPA